MKEQIELEEQKVSIETIELAVKKGFDYKIYKDAISYELNPPTQSMLQRWLREKHDMHIEILLTEDRPYKMFYYRNMKIGQYFSLSHTSNYFNTFEEALEEGLCEALKIIKNYENKEI